MDTPAHEVSFLENLQNLEHKINFLKEQSFRGNDAFVRTNLKKIK
jgi:hypothetical protein